MRAGWTRGKTVVGAGWGRRLAAMIAALALLVAACGGGETDTSSGDDTAADDVVPRGEAVVEEAPTGADEPDAGDDDTDSDGGAADDGADESESAGASDELSVDIDCPPTIVLNEQIFCDILTTGAVSGEWRLPGFTDAPIEMDTVPGANNIFIEPTNPAVVGAWFTITAEVVAADGEVAEDQHRFTIESSADTAALIDDLNIVTTSTPINFASGSAEIQSGDLPALDRVVDLLLAAPDAAIEVGGHTDDQGDDATNQALSEARAQAVVDYFVSSGVSPQQVFAAGYGESQPIADNSTDEGRAENRRIEFRESGGSPFISIDCPAEFVLGVETFCDIVTANAAEGSWRVDGFTGGDIPLEIIPGTNEIFIEPDNPAAVGMSFVIEVSVVDAAGQVAQSDHTFVVVEG